MSIIGGRPVGDDPDQQPEDKDLDPETAGDDTEDQQGTQSLRQAPRNTEQRGSGDSR